MVLRGNHAYKQSDSIVQKKKKNVSTTDRDRKAKVLLCTFKNEACDAYTHLKDY